MLTDPNFYAVAIPAVALVGLSKGGLGGAFALIGVPLGIKVSRRETSANLGVADVAEVGHRDAVHEHRAFDLAGPPTGGVLG